jgi:hypothetical protein
LLEDASASATLKANSHHRIELAKQGKFDLTPLLVAALVPAREESDQAAQALLS